MGLDTASIDYGQSRDFASHRVLGRYEVPIFENVANLDGLPETDFEIIALPMKIGSGSGGPLRIVAILHDAQAAGSRADAPYFSSPVPPRPRRVSQLGQLGQLGR